MLDKVTFHAVAYKQVSQLTSITIHHKHRWPCSSHLPYVLHVAQTLSHKR